MQVVFIAEMLREKEIKDTKNSYRAAAFSSYLQGAGKQKRTFNDYLRAIGLSEDTDDNKNPKENRENELKKALSVIERVNKLKSKRKK